MSYDTKKIMDDYEEQLLEMKLEIECNNILISEMIEELNSKEKLIVSVSA